MRSMGRFALIAVLLLGGCTATDTEPEPAACSSDVQTGPLPEWARGGFSDDGAGTPHVLGRKGDIIAVLFGRTLSSPPALDRSNKILWVSRVPVTPGGSLEITAQLDGTSETAKQTVPGGPGPSGVDMPRPGCWRFTLAWSGHTDEMDLIYQPGPSDGAPGQGAPSVTT